MNRTRGPTHGTANEEESERRIVKCLCAFGTLERFCDLVSASGKTTTLPCVVQKLAFVGGSGNRGSSESSH